MRRLRCIFRLAAAAIAVVVLVGAAACAFVLGTPAGARFAVGLAERATGGALVVEEVTGALLGAPAISGLRYESDSLRVAAERVTLEWRPGRLFAGAIEVELITVTALELTVRDGTEQAADEPAPASVKDGPPSLPTLPVAIVIERIGVDGARIEAAGRRFELDALSAGLGYDDERVALSDFTLDAGPHHLSARASTTPDAGEVAARVDYDGRVAGREAHVDLGADGSSELIALTLKLSEVAEARLDAEFGFRDDGPFAAFELAHETLPADLTGLPVTVSGGGLSGTASTRQIELHYAVDVAAAPDAPRYTLTVDADSVLPQRDDEPVSADLAWQLSAPAPSEVRVDGTGRVSYESDHLVVRHRTAAPYPTGLGLDLTLGDDPVIEAALDIERFAPLAVGGVPLTVAGGRITASGVKSALAVAGELDAEVEPVGELALELAATVGSDGADVETFTLALLEGEARVSGRVDWQREPEGRFELVAEKIHLAGLPELPEAVLGGRLDGRFRVAEAGAEATAELRALEGHWRDQPLSGSGAFSLTPAAMAVDGLELAAGRNRAALSARLGESLSGRVDLALPDLAALDARLAGSVSGEGELSGTRETPAITLEVNGADLAFEEVRLAGLDAVLDLDTAQGAPRSSLRVRGRELALSGRDFAGLTLTAGGTRDAHEAALVLTPGEDAALGARLVVSGGLEPDTRWRGRITEFELGGTPAGDLALAAPLAVTLDPERRITTDRGCLEAGQAALCVSFDGFGSGAGALKAQLSGLPLALAGPYLPSTVELEGALGGEADIAYAASSGGAEAVPVGTVELAIDGGGVRLTADAGDTVRIPMQRGDAQVNLAPDRYSGDVALALPGWLTLAATGERDRGGSGALNLSFDVDLLDLAWLENFVPELTGSEGRAIAVGAITGTLEAPVVTARVSTREAHLRVPEAGVDLDDLELEVVTDPSRRVTIDGRLGAAAGGELTVAGVLDTAAMPVAEGGDWPIRLDLRGTDFAAVRLPEADLDVSPTLELRARTDGRIDLTGEVLIPKLRFELVQVPASTVSVSDDEVIVGPDGAPVTEPRGADALQGVSADLKVVLGDDIRIEGLGLSTGLAGDLDLKRAPDDAAPAVASGNVRMVGGHFDAYGQDLIVEKGAFLFGGPIDNPALDVRAVRAGIPVTAGVLVSGTARSPRIDLFSNPAMDDPNTLSWILTGSPLSGASDSDASLLAQAATEFGLEQAGLITNELKGLFQLDELGVASDDGALENTALVAGKQITPKLSLRTQLDLFDQFWSFFLRYDLAQHWAVEAESGRRQGADVIYTIDRERFFDFSWPWTDDD